MRIPEQGQFPATLFFFDTADLGLFFLAHRLFRSLFQQLEEPQGCFHRQLPFQTDINQGLQPGPFQIPAQFPHGQHQFPGR